MVPELSQEARKKLPIIVQLELQSWDRVQALHVVHRDLYNLRKALCQGGITAKDYVDGVWELVQIPRKLRQEFRKDPEWAAQFTEEEGPLLLDTRLFKEAAEALYRHRQLIDVLRAEYLNRVRAALQDDFDRGYLDMEFIRELVGEIARDIREPESAAAMLPVE